MNRPANHRILTFLTRPFLFLRLSLQLLWAAAFNEAYLRRFAELYTLTKIDEWLALERITPIEADRLKERIHSPAVTEYLKCFMLQLALTVFELPILNNIIIIALALILNELMILLYFFLVPLLRTIYTLTRMWQNRHREIRYGTALVIGALPKIGTIAYPMQMLSSHPNLSRFLVRSQTCAWIDSVPVIGGYGSRLERVTIRIVDWVISVINVVIQVVEWAIAAITRKMPRK